MKTLLLLFTLTGVAVSYEPVLQNYHENVGIPAAARIKQQEQTLDFDGTRIVGGAHTRPGDIPYLGGLLIRLRSGVISVCGSSLLTNTRSVTAAHCWWDGRNVGDFLTLVHGSALLFSGGVRTTTSMVEVHLDFNPANYNNDVAMIYHAFVGYTDLIRNIALPLTMLYEDFAGFWGIAAGFGKNGDSAQISTSQAQKRVWLGVITNEVCRQTYGSSVVIASALCTSGVYGDGTCDGDSGGPLVIDNVLVGIISFRSARGCNADQHSGFARVTSFVPWIRSRI